MQLGVKPNMYLMPTLPNVCAVAVNTVSPTQLGEIEKEVSKSTNQPRVERQRGKQHVGKAGNGEETLKPSTCKTCVTW